MLYPDNIEKKIGFDKIREIIKTLCSSELGKERIGDMSYSFDFDKLILELTQQEECVDLLQETEDGMPLGSVVDLRSMMDRTKVHGTFIDQTDLMNLRLNVSTLHTIVSYIKRQDEERFSSLIKIVADAEMFPQIERSIDKIIDKYGTIKDNASAGLNDIRRSMHMLQTSISKTLHSILKQAQVDGVVEKDASPTLREGRLVIPVSAMNKRRIQGIVHDESATGKTAYVEPSAVVELNNRLRELQSDERREVIRILIEFTDSIRPYYPSLLDSFYILGLLDALKAKTMFAIQTNAIKPYMVSDCEIDWFEARHPLLERSLKSQGKKIEPLNIRIDSKQKILIISGPNAGGKSVCLKTVGLLQYMLQCGLLIPVHERSRAGVYSSMFIDIGDEQSIENDLSTYSSHLLNMKNFIKHSNNKSLILIDEFGTGTEPQLGGAIAESVLDKLRHNGVMGVVTTHYTNLKHYAAKHEGIVNGAMLYDRNKMQPLFALSIGTAGSSFAIEIARKIGLPEDVIKMASEMVGNETVDFDKHLQDVARDKRYWENKRKQIKDKEKKLQLLVDKYELQMGEIRRTEKQIIKDAKLKAVDLISKSNAEIERTIKTIKETSAEKMVTKELRENLTGMKEQMSKQLERVDKKKDKENFKKGDMVSISGHQMAGQILEIQGKYAIVAFGGLKSNVSLNKLERASKNQINNISTQSNTTNVDGVRVRQLNFKQDLDVRGMRVDEAVQAVIYYIDDASMLGVSTVRILHGTGTGALRQAIRDYLHAIASVDSYRDEHVQFGGAGITVVDMR